MISTPSSSSSRDHVLSEHNMNVLHRPTSTFNGTMKPVPPPKPNHLTSAFTGTLNSDALKSYIKQHSQRISVISSNSKQSRNRTKNTSSSSQYATDTFRTSREDTEEDEDDEMASWGTARQSPSPLPGKLGLADIFAPLSIPGGDSMKVETNSVFTIRPEPIKSNTSRISKELEENSSEFKTPTKEGLSPLSHTSEDDDEPLVSTIKLGKKESLSFMIENMDEDVEGDQGVERTAHPSRACSSDEGTVRSREPSILSRLSSFEDDFDEESGFGGNLVDYGQNAELKNGLDQTPRKNWMHARDGSAFERASPKNLKIIGAGSKINSSKHTLEMMAESERDDFKSGLPPQSHGLPMLVAGPPPIRPKSIAVEISGEGSGKNVETLPDSYADSSLKTPTQEKTQAECEIFADIPSDNALTSSIPDQQLNPVSKSLLAVNETAISKSSMSSRRREVERGIGRAARALYEFQGEPRFNELNLAPGQVFEILREDVQDGWSLAAAEQSNVWTKGLVPQGWYTYIQEFTASPQQNQASLKTDQGVNQSGKSNMNGTSLVVPMIRSHSSISSNGCPNNPDERVLVRSRQDASRPASGVGQMSTSFADAKSAIQILTQMKRSSSTGSISPPNVFNTSSNIRTASGSRIIEHPIREVSTEDNTADATTLMINDVRDTSISSEFSEQDDPSNMESETVTNISIETNATSETTSIPAWRLPGIFGGRSLNRFAPFVSSGAEQYILSERKNERITQPPNQIERQHECNIGSGNYGGPSWKHEGVDLIVEVHSPEVHTDDRGKLYTAYVVHTSFILSPEENAETKDLLLDPYVRPEEPSMTSSVYRRFNQFRWLNNHLQKYYPTIMCTFPPMPSVNEGAGKSTRFDEIFVERRRRHLQSWLSCIVRQPILSKDVGVRFFLEAEEEGEEWFGLTKKISDYNNTEPSSFLFSHTFHPMFNFDINEAEVESKRMSSFHEVYERCMSNSNEGGVLNTYKNVRINTAKSSETYRQLSLSILRLITGTYGTNVSNVYTSSPSRILQSSQAILPPMGNVGRRGPNGATNEDRAWCWREGCSDCRKLTNAMQITAEAFQNVANEYQSHSEGNLFEIHDRIHNLIRPNQQQQALLDVHRNALAMYRAATGEKNFEDQQNVGSVGSGQDLKAKMCNQAQPEPHLHSQLAERIASRSETVLNVTMSEMDRFHEQRVQDWNALSREMLDEQIAFYKDLVHTLENARGKVDEALGVSSIMSSSTDSTNHTASNSDSSNESAFSVIHSQAQGPLLPSPYEVQLSQPIVQMPLEMPNMQLTESSAASKAIRPVALAGEVLSEWLVGN